MEHAFGTCPGLDELWVRAAETFLLPAIMDAGKERRPLVNCVGPHILSGVLVVIRLNNTHRPAKLAQDQLEQLHAWLSLIGAALLVILEAQRQTARRGV